MRRIWGVMALLSVWSAALAAQDESSSALERLQLRVRADEAEVVKGTEILTGNVRVEVLNEDSQVMLTVHADRAERRGLELKLQQEVRLETSEGVAGVGLEPLLDAHGLTLSETRVEAESVHFQAVQRRIEIRQLDAEATGKYDNRSPRAVLRAESVILLMDDEGAWKSRVTKPRAGLRFD